MSWTKKHHDLSVKNGWWASATNVATYLYNKASSTEPTEIEFHSEKFQTYIKRIRGRKYHRTTPRKAMINLAEKSEGLVVILHDYGKGVFKVMVYPLSYLSENRSSSKDSSNTAAAGKGFGREVKKRNQKKDSQQQQKFIEQANSLFKQVGLKFDPDALVNIWRLSTGSISRVVKSIELLLYRNESKKIPRPHGFIIECLKKRWSDNFDLYYEPELPSFNSKKDLRHFVHEITKSIIHGQKNYSAPK